MIIKGKFQPVGESSPKYRRDKQVETIFLKYLLNTSITILPYILHIAVFRLLHGKDLSYKSEMWSYFWLMSWITKECKICSIWVHKVFKRFQFKKIPVQFKDIETKLTQNSFPFTSSTSLPCSWYSNDATVLLKFNVLLKLVLSINF